MTNRKNDTQKTKVEYGYFSKLLKEPFDTIEELKEAEEVYTAKMKAKEDAAAQKKADATKVEDAFKTLNAARKAYKEDLTQLTKEYAESLNNLKKAFELGKNDIHNKLAEAEAGFDKAHKEFTDKHPEGFHLTLRDGDFEMTLEKRTSDESDTYTIFDILGWCL